MLRTWKAFQLEAGERFGSDETMVCSFYFLSMKLDGTEAGSERA